MTGFRQKKQNPSLGTAALMTSMTVIFIIVMVFPLTRLFAKAFLDKSGSFVGFSNYVSYFSTPALSVSIWNTIFISLVSTCISTALGFAYAYALSRTNMKGKLFFRYAALIPIFMPTIVHGLGLIYLFGKQGLLTSLGLQIPLYGKLGIILSEIIYTFPQAFLMFSISLSYADGRLYEAADSFGSSTFQKFFRITIPEVKYTLINCLFLCFTLAFTDFGAPKVVGGSYNVLATDIYKQVAGQFQMNMGAVVGTLLLIPAVLSFFVDRMTTSKNSSGISAKASKLQIRNNPKRDFLFTLFCSLIVGSFVLLIGALFIGAFMKYYPYDKSFTLEHFRFNASTGGITSFLNSVKMSAVSAVIGTIFVFVYAYLIEKGKAMPLLKKAGRAMSVLPSALPGMVIGLSYIFFFNAKENPFHFIYGTMIILVLANVLHFYSVAYVTASSALKKLDKDYESVSESMKIPLWKTFFKVSLPMCLPAVLEIALYYFVNSMVTVSALVFLYSSNFKIAAVAISHMEEAGDAAQAAAMSLLILLVNILVRLIYEAVLYILRQRKKDKTMRALPSNTHKGCTLDPS